MNEKFSSKYDAWYDASTDEWLESMCDDPECEYCTKRPSKPSFDPDLKPFMIQKPTIEDVLTELEELKKRVRELERSNRPLPSPFAPGPTFKLNQCPTCGLRLEGTMGYVCSVPRCPTGLGGAWS